MEAGGGVRGRTKVEVNETFGGWMGETGRAKVEVKKHL